MKGSFVQVFICALVISSGFLMMHRAHAEFTLNFQPKGSGTFTTSATHNGLSQDNGIQTGQTRYLQGNSLQRPEIVTDPDNGNSYYHMIIGDLADGFIQEYFIQMGYGTYSFSGAACCVPADAASASGGVSTFDRSTQLGNGYDPLDMNKDSIAQASESGNGTGNPTRIIMRQIVSDGEIMMEFLKDKYAYKPRISQQLTSPDITAFYDMDMRNSTYSDAATPGVLINTIQLWGEGVPGVSATFDHATEAQNPYVTGGMFTYTDGADFGGSAGTYSYADGASFDQTGLTWKSYWDPVANNPWSFESGKVVP
jgi:hypothetical protein